MLRRFWAAYERHYVVNVTVALTLFGLQVLHLVWLGAEVIAERATGTGYLELTGVLQGLNLAIDYLEIPALISVSLVYLNELRFQRSEGPAGGRTAPAAGRSSWGQLRRRRPRWKPLLFLLLVNSQWLHILWITDEFVAAELTGGPAGTSLPTWLAWVAILIDYLELPVIVDTGFKLAGAVRDRRLARYLKEDSRADVS